MVLVLSETPAEEIYTVFPSWQRKVTVALLGMATLVSPLTATIYLPLLPLLSTHFQTSLQAINLTITVYIIFQAIAPLLLASASDHCGRRPIYLFTFTLYTLASFGLALNKSSYPALIVLRALQSLGASTVLSVNYGTIADICVPAERGKMLGPVLAAGNVGTSVGPIIGGWIALESGSFRWAFWTLVIFGGVMVFSLALLLPETARNIVGNGSVKEEAWNQPLWRLWRTLLLKRRARKHQITDHGEVNSNNDDLVGQQEVSATHRPTRSLKLTSPLASIRIIFYRDTSLIIWVSSSFYALWYCIQASIPITFKSPPYLFDDLDVGLAYLPGSIGVVISMYVTGKVMDYNYKHAARKIGFTVDKVKGDDLANFPVECARSRWCSPLLLLSFALMAGYGWAIERHTHPSIPLIFQFFQGFLSTWVVQCYSALLVDVFPDTPSTAATASNVARCVLSAVAVAVLQPLVDAVGKGWFFVILGVLCGIGGLVAQTALRKWGMGWRRLRTKKKQSRERQHEALQGVTVDAGTKDQRTEKSGLGEGGIHP